MIGCNNKHVVQNFPEDQDLKRKQSAGNMFGNKDGIILFQDNDNSKKNIKDNSLWGRTVNFISSLLPISIIDKTSGLIVTDWGNIKSISNNDNLYKINAVINNNDLNISVFEKNSNERNIEIENKIKQIILKN